jgi:hypothetical protein
MKLYPGYIVPPLPTKKVGKRRFELDFIHKRMKLLNLFLNSLCENEYFKSCEALISFLSLQDRAVLENKMKEYNNLSAPLYVEDFRTFDGKIHIIDDASSERHFNNINDFYFLQKQLMERINTTFKTFHKNITLAANSLDSISKDFFTLNTLNKKVFMKDEVKQSFKECSLFFKNWKKVIANQNLILKTYIKDFFKQIRQENNCYLDIIRERSELKQKYNSDASKLTAKKDKLWTQMDVAKWELNSDLKLDRAKLTSDRIYAYDNMCFKETNTVKNLYNRLGYLSQKCMEELKRLIDIHCVRYKNNFKQFVENFYPTLTEVKKF